MSGQHLISTPLGALACHRCGAVVLAAMVEGLRVRVDPVALTAPEILAATIAARPLYRLICGGRELVPLAPPQRAAMIRVRGPTMPQHRCGSHFMRHESVAEAEALEPDSTNDGIPF